MPPHLALLVPVRDLRVGMFIQLDLGWMRHPFPFGSFRISSEAQIRVLHSLGVSAVRCLPDKSDPDVMAEWQAARALETVPQTGPLTQAGETSAPDEAPSEVPPAAENASSESVPPTASHATPAATEQGVTAMTPLRTLQERLLQCDQRYLSATQHYMELVRAAPDSPWDARRVSERLVGEALEVLAGAGEALITLLSDGVGERSAQHPVNVMVLSLLLGRALGMGPEALQALGVAAVLHDIGMLRWDERRLADLQREELRDHVGQSVALVQRMELSSEILSAIAQHHERADGSGYPLALLNEDMALPGRIIALVNHYDRLCNPVRAGQSGLTPHEALSVIYSREKHTFDEHVLAAFLKMMGVYPAGSVVELTDGRFGLVTSVNASRMLKPEVQVHVPSAPQGAPQVQTLDWNATEGLSIRRSLRPAQLPLDALQALSPRARICYYFERAIAAGEEGAPRE